MMKKTFSMIFALASLAFTNFEFSTLHADCVDGAGSQLWEELKAGNREFVNNPKYIKQRKPLVNGQRPNVIILSCSDSRVPPEIIFSQGLGDLFTTRSAGQVADDVVVDSIEFSVRTFESSLLIVMGHTDCGAVIGALERLRKNGGVIDKKNGHLLAVLIPIETAIVQSGMDIYAPNAVEVATRVNICYIANLLIDQSPVIAKAVAEGRLSIVGAEYNLKTGKVVPLFEFD